MDFMAKKTPAVLSATSHPRVDLAPTRRAMKARTVGAQSTQAPEQQAPGLIPSAE